jgi:hypothetical protein
MTSDPLRNRSRKPRTTGTRPGCGSRRGVVLVAKMACLTVLLFNSFSITHAQATFRVEGLVRDTEGRALAGAQISIDTDNTVSVTTDEQGRFEISGLEPGTYSVRAALAGFRPQTQLVRVGTLLTARVTFVLSPAPVELATRCIASCR